MEHEQQKGSEQIKQVSLLQFVMQQLIKNLHADLKYQNCDANRILKVMFEYIKDARQGHQKQEILEIWKDIELFIWNLSVCSKYWVEMFNNEHFITTDRQALDMHVFTNKIYKHVLYKGLQITKQAKRLSDLISAQIFMFLQEISRQICQCYETGRQIILQQTKSVEDIVKSSPIVNFYLLYKVLMEVSVHCEDKLVQYLSSTLFRNIQLSYSQSFANYIIEKHQILSLVFDSNSTNTHQEEPLLQILQRVKSDDNVKWREAIRQDGQSAIILQFQNQTQGAPSDNYMIKMDKKGKIKVLNCNTLRMKWKITEAAQKNYDILKIVNDKNKLAQKLRGSPLKMKELQLTDHFSTFGGALGKCLASIKSYDSVGDFMFDLSKRSIVNGTFNYIATNIPLIGIMFATGGYTYTLYAIFSNKIVNKRKKLQQAGFITVDMLSSFGSGLVGAVIGQSVIPIPFLGAFIGGMVGGFIGQMGAKVISNKLESLRFKHIIKQLQQSIQPGGFWEVNKTTLQIYGLARQNFYNTIPSQIQQRLGADKFWFAIISFTIISFNQSKKRAKFIESKIKKLKKQSQKQQNYGIIFEQMKEDMNYEASLDLMCIIKYLEQNRIQIIQCYVQLQSFITALFSRIK